MSKVEYKRILLKLSGEALLGKKEYGIDPDAAHTIACRIKEVSDLGVEIGIVIGGGNIFRGMSSSASRMDRATADYMGMLGTVINGMALQDAMEKIGLPTRLQSAMEIRRVAELYIRRRSLRHLEKGRVIVFAGGTGNPFFTTDTAAALRASEIDANILLKGTKVDGVYDADPVTNPGAKKYDKLTYIDVLKQRLRVMDATAISLCMENQIPIIVFNMWKKGNLKKIVLGEIIGTIVEEE